MKRSVTGITVAAVVLYFWGFLVWGLGPYGTMIFKQPQDEAAAAQMLREQFPEDGTYFLPTATHSPEELEQLFTQGPVAFVHVLDSDGRPALDPAIMMKGFGLNLVVIILIALLLKQAAPALPSYGDRIRFVALAGLASALLIDIGDWAWWEMDLGWMTYRGGYHLSAWVVTGLILGRFIDSSATETPQAS